MGGNSIETDLTRAYRREDASEVAVLGKLEPGLFCRPGGVKSSGNSKKARMCRDNDRFPPKSRCRLSYQAGPIPRILRMSDMPVCGDRQFVIVF
jgi:hypothetical protein